jgi:phage/plasmid-associated DNA primase
MKKVGKDEMRDAFIIMLFKNWIDNVKDKKIVPVPECIKADSAEYCDSCDVVKQFLDSGYIITGDSKDRIKSSALYLTFKTYCKSNGIDKILGDKKFKENMLEIRGIAFKKSSGSFYCGLEGNGNE